MNKTNAFNGNFPNMNHQPSPFLIPGFSSMNMQMDQEVSNLLAKNKMLESQLRASQDEVQKLKADLTRKDAEIQSKNADLSSLREQLAIYTATYHTQPLQQTYQQPSTSYQVNHVVIQQPSTSAATYWTPQVSQNQDPHYSDPRSPNEMLEFFVSNTIQPTTSSAYSTTANHVQNGLVPNHAPETSPKKKRQNRETSVDSEMTRKRHWNTRPARTTPDKTPNPVGFTVYHKMTPEQKKLYMKWRYENRRKPRLEQMTEEELKEFKEKEKRWHANDYKSLPPEKKKERNAKCAEWKKKYRERKRLEKGHPLKKINFSPAGEGKLTRVLQGLEKVKVSNITEKELGKFVFASTDPTTETEILGMETLIAYNIEFTIEKIRRKVKTPKKPNEKKPRKRKYVPKKKKTEDRLEAIEVDRSRSQTVDTEEDGSPLRINLQSLLNKALRTRKADVSYKDQDGEQESSSASEASIDTD